MYHLNIVSAQFRLILPERPLCLIFQVKLSLYKSGVAVKELEFDGEGSDIRSWFDVSKLTVSPWTDLSSTTTDFNFFSAEG